MFGSLIWGLSILAFKAINSPLSIILTAFIYFDMLYFYSHSIPSNFSFPFWILLWLMGYLEVQYLISKYLGTFQISVIDFQFSLLWSDNVIYMISIFINLWKLFGSIMWSILVNIPCVLVKNVYYAFFGCSVDKFQLRSIYG